MKRFVLFLILVFSGVLILWKLVEEEDTLVPPPPAYDLLDDDRRSDAETSDPGGDPGARDNPIGSDAETEMAGGSGVPAGARPANSTMAEDGRQQGAHVKDLDLPIRETYTHEDGTTEEVMAVSLHVGQLRQVEGSNLLEADDVSFVFFDLTPAERAVAEGTSDHATLFSDKDDAKSILDSHFSRNFILQGNVRVNLHTLEAVSGDTLLLSELLYFEGDLIRSDLDSGPVRIVTEGMEIEGLGMEINLVERTLAFQKDMTARGSRFKMPLFKIGVAPSAAPRPPEEEGSEGEEPGVPVTIACGGPFLFRGERDTGKKDAAAGSLLGSGTLYFSGGVEASRGESRLLAKSLVMVFEKNPLGEMQLVSLDAEDGKERVRLDSGERRIFCRSLFWRAEGGGSSSRLVGDPLIEGLALPIASASGGESLYQMSAREEVTLGTVDRPEDGGTKIVVRLKQGGQIRPADASVPESEGLFVEGDDIELIAAAEPEEDDKSPSYTPELLKITGNGRFVMDGVLEGDEIVMKLQPGRNGPIRIVTLTGSALLQREEFRLAAPEIVVRAIPGVGTEIVTDRDFTMDISLEGFSGTRGRSSRLAGSEVTARGEKRLRLSWPEKDGAGGASGQQESNHLVIEGPYAIRVDLGGGEIISMSGRELFEMGTAPFEGIPLTILDLKGSPHIELTRTKAESMTLDCQQARLELNHEAAQAGSETAQAGSEDAQAGSEDAQAGPEGGFFSKSIVKKIEALQDVVLYYGSSLISCESVEWNLTSDFLVAEGGDDPVVIETEYGMKISGKRFLLRPDREEMSILEPGAFIIRGGQPPTAAEGAVSDRESGSKGP